MSVNVKNKKCSGCKYAGIYLCVNSNKCDSNSLYTSKSMFEVHTHK